MIKMISSEESLLRIRTMLPCRTPAGIETETFFVSPFFSPTSIVFRAPAIASNTDIETSIKAIDEIVGRFDLGGGGFERIFFARDRDVSRDLLRVENLVGFGFGDTLAIFGSGCD